MSDFEISHPECVKGKTFYESDCGSEGYARALFVSWNILSMYIFVSMVSLSVCYNMRLLTYPEIVYFPYLREFQLCLSTIWGLFSGIKGRN
jgi:hypothetical protein